MWGGRPGDLRQSHPAAGAIYFYWARTGNIFRNVPGKGGKRFRDVAPWQSGTGCLASALEEQQSGGKVSSNRAGRRFFGGRGEVLRFRSERRKKLSFFVTEEGRGQSTPARARSKRYNTFCAEAGNEASDWQTSARRLHCSNEDAARTTTTRRSLSETGTRL